MSLATDREKFELLYKRLETLHNGSIDVVFKATAAILIVAGWLVTSRDARAAFASNSAVRWATVCVVILYAVLYIVGALRTIRQSLRLSEQLNDLKYVPSSYYSDLVLSKSVAAPYIAMNTAACAAVVVLVNQTAG